MNHSASYYYTHTSGISKDDLPFTLESVGCQCIESEAHVNQVTRNDYFVLFCVDGHCIVDSLYHRFSMKKGDVVCFCPNQNETILTQLSTGCICCHICFHTNMQYYRKMLNPPCHLQFEKQNSIKLEDLFDELYELVAFEIGEKDTTINLIITEIMTLLVKTNQERILFSLHHQTVDNYHYRRPTLPGKTETSPKRRNEINKVLLFIHSRYKEHITLDELSNMVHFNKCYFVKLFRSLVGVSPYEYIINLRINEAKRLLITTKLSINNIAYQTGFLDTNNFIRRFRSRTEMTPLQYRDKFIVLQID